MGSRNNDIRFAVFLAAIHLWAAAKDHENPPGPGQLGARGHVAYLVDHNLAILALTMFGIIGAASDWFPMDWVPIGFFGALGGNFAIYLKRALLD